MGSIRKIYSFWIPNIWPLVCLNYTWTTWPRELNFHEYSTLSPLPLPTPPLPPPPLLFLLLLFILILTLILIIIPLLLLLFLLLLLLLFLFLLLIILILIILIILILILILLILLIFLLLIFLLLLLIIIIWSLIMVDSFLSLLKFLMTATRIQCTVNYFLILCQWVRFSMSTRNFIGSRHKNSTRPLLDCRDSAFSNYVA